MFRFPDTDESPPRRTAAAGLVVAIDQSVIGDHQRFTLSVRTTDDEPFSGYLDIDQFFFPLGTTVLAECAATHGPWDEHFVTDGEITLTSEQAGDDGRPLPEGLYVARFRPRDTNGPFSNQIGFVIDRAARPVSEDMQHNSGRYVMPHPVPGTYGVYLDLTVDDQFNGYSKIEFEYVPCDYGGLIQRFTKTASTAYWGPSADPANQEIRSFRWCIGPSPTNNENFRPFVGYMHGFDRRATEQSSLAATYYPEESVGALGRLGSPLAVASFLGPSPLFYTLAPVNLFPEELPEQFVPIIDRLAKYDALNGVFNNWHVEVRDSRLGGIYEVRYVEWALGIADLSATAEFASTPSRSASDWIPLFRWSIYEDWDWNADGTLNRLTQVGNTRAHITIGPADVPPDCWRTPGGCERPIRHNLVQRYGYVPDRQALSRSRAASKLAAWGLSRLVDLFALAFGAPTFEALRLALLDRSGNHVEALAVAPDEAWTLLVETPDSAPYDGFLQIRRPDGPPVVWADTRNYPIYVYNGRVTVLPGALDLSPGTTLELTARQQMLNANIAADIALDERAQPNEEAMPFSNTVRLTVSKPGRV